MRAALALLRRGQTRVAELITARFPLEQTGAALAAQRSGEALKAVVRAVRAALLFGAEDLRVHDVPDPVPGPGEVLVRIEAATTCGTDVKSWQRGHPLLTTYPASFGHEMAGVREDTGERVLVGDSVACGTLPPLPAGRPQICSDPRWVFGGFAELMAAPEEALHAVPDGLEPAAAAMAEPLAAAVHAIARAPARPIAPDVGVLGGGPMGQMLAALLVAEGRTVTLADRHAERRAQAEAAGAMTAERLADHDVVFEAVGRPDAWREAVAGLRPRRLRRVRRRLRGRHRRRAPDPPAPLRRARPPRRLPPLARGGRPRARAARRGRGGLARPGRRPDRARRPAHGARQRTRAGAQVGRHGPSAEHGHGGAVEHHGDHEDARGSARRRRARRGGAEEDHLQADPDRLRDLEASPSGR